MRTVVTAALVALLATPAAAVPPWLEPEPEDFDHAEETRSEFWERTLHPNRELYDNRVERARRLLSSGQGAAREKEAEALLGDAIALEKDNPVAYWVLSSLRERQERWADCARLRRQIAAMEPDFEPTDHSADKAYALDYGLGLCASREGDHDRAIARYKRILSRGLGGHDYKLHWRLGESYMAIGRLGEAIVAFEESHKRYSGSPRVMFALAVAYDRDDQTARSREYLSAALARDPSLSRLTSSHVDSSYTPAEDRYYYEALGHEGKGEYEQALVRFRHYLDATGEGPWASRVRYHLDALAAEPVTAERIQIAGAHGIDSASLEREIQDARPALDACMQAVPGVLLRVQITTLAAGGDAGEVEPGLRTTVLYTFGADSEATTEAIACVEKVADDLRVPRPSAKQGRYLQISFPVIAR